MPKRAPIPKPEGPVDPRLEAAAFAALSQKRGKAVWKGGPPQAGAIAAAILRAKIPPKSGKSVLELKRQWRDIVGDKLAQMTEPEKISDPPARLIGAVSLKRLALVPVMTDRLPALIVMALVPLSAPVAVARLIEPEFRTVGKV